MNFLFRSILIIIIRIVLIKKGFYMTKQIPSVTFQTRVRDDSISGDNPFKWESKSTDQLFSNKKLYFSLCLVLLHQLVLLSNFQTLIIYITNLKNLGLKKYIVFL